MTNSVKDYYDKFSPRFINDLVAGNARVKQQLRFFAEAIPSSTARILVIGCGSGEGAYSIAKSIARNAKVVALDISSENITMAKALFRHDNITYLELDVLSGGIEGKWDVIVLPDVYEHIPLAGRRSLHEKINDLLDDRGKVILTVPSPAHQDCLRRKGEGLQIIDEDVTLEDLVCMAGEVVAELTYFVYVSVWNSNDYIHAILERNTAMRPIGPEDCVPVKGWRKPSLMQNILRMPGLRTISTKCRCWKIKRALS